MAGGISAAEGGSDCDQVLIDPFGHHGVIDSFPSLEPLLAPKFRFRPPAGATVLQVVSLGTGSREWLQGVASRQVHRASASHASTGASAPV